MRWVRFIFLGMVLVVLPLSLYAAQTATITVTVTVRYISVAVSPNTYDFGFVDPATYTTATSDIDVTNDGNDTEDFKLQITTGPAAWTVEETSANPGAEEYKLLALFNSVAPGDIYVGDAPAEGTDDIIFESAQKNCDATNFSGDQDGDNVPSSGTINLWFRFGAPSSTTATNQQSIVVTVSAYKSTEF
ncbi:MAG: hypothetical protein NC820_01735 [Candidatus Omnitrophica bacterium]|nr:hypothetical protein [Candidatus Omnitrophota bacterium]